MEYNCMKCDCVTNSPLCGECELQVSHTVNIKGVVTYVFTDNTFAKGTPVPRRTVQAKDRIQKDSAPQPVKKKLPKPI